MNEPRTAVRGIGKSGPKHRLRADGYLAIAFVAAFAIVLIACMKPMKVYFDSTSPTPTK